MTTRRAILASAAALMAPAVASAAIPTSQPDAELIRLGREFAVAAAAFREANSRWRAADNAILTAFAPQSRQGGGDDWFASFQRAYEASPAAPALAENDRWLDACDALASQIRAIRPTTLAGLTAHAKVARFEGFAPAVLERDRVDLDCNDAALLNFLDLVEEFA